MSASERRVVLSRVIPVAGACRLRSAALVVITLLAGSRLATADCCRVVKTDPDTPPMTLRVCESNAPGDCDPALYVGTLALGESVEICSATPTIRYAEYDDAAASFGPPIEAVCAGDVEI